MYILHAPILHQIYQIDASNANNMVVDKQQFTLGKTTKQRRLDYLEAQRIVGKVSLA